MKRAAARFMGVLGVGSVVVGLLWTIPGWGRVARSCGGDGSPQDSCAALGRGMQQAFILVLLGAAMLIATWVLKAIDERDQRLRGSGDLPEDGP